jgi:serine phosphatase RsbU (regulator of sigma subunit)
VMALLHLRTTWQPFGVLLPLDLIAVFLSLICFSLVLFGQFRSSLQRQQVIAEDLKQAQEMQQLLIPDRLPRVPGWSIETEYHPAREVGGDFFQIIPHSADGSILIVAGDVAGKGLQAGMLVAMLVGAIRTESTHSSDPIQILKALNGRLCGEHALCGAEHAQATCLALLIDEDGKATLANAGHLPPYLNGIEINIEGSLPLGMIAEVELATMNFRIEPGDRLAFVSDGVVEAQSARGELFGFDRTRALSTQSAEAIARAAKYFGQEDDITVLTVARAPKPEAVIA